MRENKLGNINGYTGGNFSGNVYDKDYLSPALSTMGGGNRQPMIIEKEKAIVAMRARGENNEQKLEPAPQGVVNTLTTVQKDNLVLETAKTTRNSDIVQTIRASYFKNGERNISENIKSGKVYDGVIEGKTEYKIRKLTPRECWRLMGYTDADFDKANEVNSATQLYKQAGNAIVKQVLMAIFAKMI